MAKIVDPDDLAQGSEIVISPGASGTIRLRPGKGDLIYADGVTLQCVYSFLKEEWKSDSLLIKYPFPMIAITEEQFELQNGWNWANQATKNSLRDGGWALKAADNTSSKEEYMNLTTLGSFEDSGNDLMYYVQTTPISAGPPIDVNFTGPVNEAIQVFGVANYGHGQDRRGTFVAYLREQGSTYDSYNLISEQGLAALTYKKYALPLSSANDIKITATDAQIVTAGTYDAIDVSYFILPQSRTIGAASYPFHVIIDGDGKTAEQIYEKIQYLLRQTSNINVNPATSAAYPVRGDIADELLTFVGDTLNTTAITGWSESGFGGVFIDNYDTDDINRLGFTDDSNTIRTFPFTATGSLVFSQTLQDDVGGFGVNNAQWWMFFTSIGTSAYGTSAAILVENANDKDLYGEVSAASIPFTFDYDENEQPYYPGTRTPHPNGRTKATNAAVTVVAIGLGTAQFVSTTADITRTTGQTISLVAALERNYSNPA
jgi:hypothetical protein